LALAPGQVTATGDLERNWGWLEPGVDWRNLGLTPQFDVTAPLAARMWEARTGQTVDGVLALDIVGLRQIMVATGPVQVGTLTLTSDNVEQYLMHDQYVGLTDNSTGEADRADALGAIASSVLRQLQGQSTDLRGLATAVSGAVAGRHLMVWSSDPVAQAAWVAAGASGRLAPDSLAVNVVSQGGNKLDQYLSVAVHVTTRRDRSGTAVTLATTLVNRTPDGQSQFIAGPFPGLPLVYGDYSGVVTVNVPGAATGVSMTGVGPLSANGAEGPTWLMAAPIVIHQGDSATVVVRFHLAAAHGSLQVVPSARVPAEQWTVGGRAFTDERSQTVSW
jgi:hypothetical protein